jgi:tetratricopeptide (TPR) repeat protein
MMTAVYQPHSRREDLMNSCMNPQDNLTGLIRRIQVPTRIIAVLLTGLLVFAGPAVAKPGLEEAPPNSSAAPATGNPSEQGPTKDDAPASQAMERETLPVCGTEGFPHCLQHVDIALLLDEARQPMKEAAAATALLMKAAAAATALIAKNPKDHEAHYLLGSAQFHMGQHDVAIEAFTEAIRIKPDCSHAYFNRAKTYNLSDKPVKALADFKAATQLAPKGASYWHGLGGQHFELKDLEGAAAAIKTALELDPSDAQTWHALAVTYWGLRQEDQAIEAWQQTIKLQPTHVDAHYNLGQIAQNKGDYDRAHRHFTAVLATTPNDLRALQKMMQVLYQRGKYDAATPYRERILEVVTTTKDRLVHAVRNKPAFCFDQFTVDELRVLALETVDQTGDLVYHYSFLVESGEGVIKSINLESSIGLEAMGASFILGQTDSTGHTTFDVSFQSMPPYEELKQLVIDAIHGKLVSSAKSALVKDDEGNAGVTIYYNPGVESTSPDPMTWGLTGSFGGGGGLRLDGDELSWQVATGFAGSVAAWFGPGQVGFDATPRFQLASAIFRDGPDDADYGGFGLSMGRHDGYLVAGPVWKISERAEFGGLNMAQSYAIGLVFGKRSALMFGGTLSLRVPISDRIFILPGAFGNAAVSFQSEEPLDLQAGLQLKIAVNGNVKKTK